VGRLTWAGDTTPSHATLVAEIYVRPVRGRSSYLETTNCVTTTTFSAGDAADVTFSETRSGMAGPVRVLREPLGVVVAIVLWEARCWPATRTIRPRHRAR
jgi:acyl-CoA reductase-like NAD-dependent aldehyde dehydrogenase